MNTLSIYFLTFIFSFCSFCYEYLLIDLIAIQTNFNLTLMNTTIGLFILGLGIGAIKIDSVTPKESRSHLIRIEQKIVIIALFSSLLIPIFLFLNEWIIPPFLIELKNDLTELYRNQESYSSLYKLIKTDLIENLIFCLFIFINSFTLGYYSGHELPLLIKEKNEKDPAFILGINYFGSVAASFVFIFIMKQLMSSHQLFILVSFVNLIALQLLKRNIKLILFFIIFAIGSFSLSTSVYKSFLKTKYYYRNHSLNLFDISKVIKNFPDVIEFNTKYQLVHKLPYINKISTNPEFGVYLNYKYQFTSYDEVLYHDSLTHIPMMIANIKPKKLLLLGAGDGLILRELLKYPTLQIKHIELDGEFLEFSKNDLDIKKLNKDSLLKNNQVNTVIGDAYTLTNLEPADEYDMIIVDFPYPANYDLLKLYSIEFFSFLKKTIKKDGIIVLDAPIRSQRFLNQMDIFGYNQKNNDIIYSTISFLKFKTFFPFTLENEGVIILSKEEKNIDIEKINFNLLNKKTVKKIPYLKFEKFKFNFKKELINSTFKPVFF